jgi:hypothetical protein
MATSPFDRKANGFRAPVTTLGNGRSVSYRNGSLTDAREFLGDSLVLVAGDHRVRHCDVDLVVQDSDGSSS